MTDMTLSCGKCSIIDGCTCHADDPRIPEKTAALEAERKRQRETLEAMTDKRQEQPKEQGLQDLALDPAFVASPSSQQAVSTKGFNPGELAALAERLKQARMAYLGAIPSYLVGLIDEAIAAVLVVKEIPHG